MSGFNLTVVFTGLVGFVENSNSTSKAKMCALLVNGNEPRASSLDGLVMRRHRAFMTFPIGNLSDPTGSPDDSFGLWYLDRDRIFFELAPADPSSNFNRFHVTRATVNGPHPETPDAQVDQTSFTWALDMQRVFSGFQVDPLLLQGAPGPADKRLAAQIFFSGGEVLTKKTTRVVWRFEPTLFQGTYQQVFADEIMIQYYNLAAARVVAHSLDPGKLPTVLDLTSLPRDANNGLLIEIVNTCDSDPLGWGDDGKPQDDEDTKWIYELAEPGVLRAIKASLQVQSKPVPIPEVVRVVSGPGGPGGSNCIPPRLASASFTCPELDH
jgi:hypothetical protein